VEFSVFLLLATFVFGVASDLIAAGAEPLVHNEYESAGISGFLDEWNKSNPGARTADAVHRSVLIRFPGAARAIAQRLEEGAKIEVAQVVFDYGGYEVHPPGYTVRHTYKSKWEKNPPRWHYVAWPLRRPWTATEEALVPTFNAWLDDAAYWGKYGARDVKVDRYPLKFGPTEVSKENPEGRMDVTALLTDETYGVGLGERLRRFEEQGLMLRKWETYDMRYQDWSAYEWAVATGGHGLTFEDARLEVHFSDGPVVDVDLPMRRDLTALAKELRNSTRGGEPTAVMPGEERIQEIADQHGFTQPEWMSDWQWEHVLQLRRLGGGHMDRRSKRLVSGDPQQYREVVDDVLRRVPRYWLGWGVQDDLLLYYMYRDALPDYVVDHMKSYWEAWLYPQTPNAELDISPQGQPKLDWWKKTKDWRGKYSFFRRRWTQGVGTMNFNHTANMGALLGGAMIDSKHAIKDGRDGLEKLLLRFWSYLDGTSQEMLDDYYFSITVSGQKMFSDFGPSRVDRLMGDMMRNRTIDLLASSYQPHLRRIVGAGGRVRMSNVLGYEQEGIYSVLHTLSPEGVLFHPDASRDAKQHGMHLFGYDFPPGRVALQSVTKPWFPQWGRHWLDEKPLPYRVTASETTRGHFRNPPLWRRVYLGHSYALASQDIKSGTVDVTAQWHGGAEQATDADQLGTLTLRYNVNQPHMAKTGGGTMPYSGGLVTFQQDNRALVLSKPPHDREPILKVAGEEGLKKLYTSIALWNFSDDPGWEIHVDGEPIQDVPISLRARQLITIRDGRAYVGIIPLPATDLGRDVAVQIEPGVPEPLGDRHKGVEVAPALMINSYNLDRDAPVAAEGGHWERITKESYGGFVIEMGDSQQFGSFQAFQKHMEGAQVESRWEADARVLHVTYESGEDVMEMGFGVEALRPAPPHFGQVPGKHREAIPYRRFNGKSPYPKNGIDRDTTLTQQGTTGRLVKNGAVLRMEEGRKGYLQTDPVSGTYVGYNPFPDLTEWSLRVPGGVEVRADGPIGLAIVSVRPEEGRLRIRQAYRREQLGEEVAERLLVFGMQKPPRVELNGRMLEGLESERVGEEAAYVIPMDLGVGGRRD
jgi:hypothetical protein